MSASDFTLFSLLIGTLIWVVIMFNDNDDEGRFS